MATHLVQPDALPSGMPSMSSDQSLHPAGPAVVPPLSSRPYLFALSCERRQVHANPIPAETPEFCLNSGLSRLAEIA